MLDRIRYESDGSHELQRVKEHRKLSYETIAKKLGRSESFVYLIATGRRKISLNDAVVLERWLKIKATSWTKYHTPARAARGAA